MPSPKRSRRKTLAYSPSMGIVQGFDQLPTAIQRAAVSKARCSMKRKNDTALCEVMKTLRKVQRSLKKSPKDDFHEDIHRRLQKIKRKLSGQKVVTFKPSRK